MSGDAPGKDDEGTFKLVVLAFEGADGGDDNGLMSDSRVWRSTPLPPKRAMEGGGGHATRSSTITGAFEPEATLLLMLVPGAGRCETFVVAVGSGKGWRRHGAVARLSRTVGGER